MGKPPSTLPTFELYPTASRKKEDGHHESHEQVQTYIHKKDVQHEI